MGNIVKQGEVIELSDRRIMALVLSKQFFNRSGLCVVCPVVSEASSDALHIEIQSGEFMGVALCEQLKTLDLSKRFYRRIHELPYQQIQEVTDAVQAIFDYYPFG